MTASKLQIGNRALQKLGTAAVGRLTVAAAAAPDVSDDVSTAAAAINLAYDPLRGSELQSNYWGFAITRQVVRAVAYTTDKVFTPATYAGGTTYAAYDLVVSSGIYYISLVSANLGHTPASSPTYWAIYYGVLIAPVWDTGLVYYRGELVYVATEVFMALKNTTAGTAPAEGTEWHNVNDGTLALTTYRSPLSGRQYAFAKPRDFLRIAPQDPKYSAIPKDWLVESGFIISDDPGPIFLRYVRDETDVTKFDPLFAEALACKIAFDICEEVTQSTAKQERADKSYATAIYRARITNAIEAGPTEQDEDELITCQR